jgi:bacteriocin-like protein
MLSTMNDHDPSRFTPLTDAELALVTGGAEKPPSIDPPEASLKSVEYSSIDGEVAEN